MCEFCSKNLPFKNLCSLHIACFVRVPATCHCPDEIHRQGRLMHRKGTDLSAVLGGGGRVGGSLSSGEWATLYKVNLESRHEDKPILGREGSTGYSDHVNRPTNAPKSRTQVPLWVWEGEQSPVGPKRNKNKKKMWVHLRDFQQWRSGSCWRIVSVSLNLGHFSGWEIKGHSLPSPSPSGGFCTLECTPHFHTCSHSLAHTVLAFSSREGMPGPQGSVLPQDPDGQQAAVRDGNQHRPVLERGSACECSSCGPSGYRTT